MSNPKTVIFDFDDLHWLEPEDCLGTIEEIVEAVPDIKLSFFTVPDLRDNEIGKKRRWCNRLLNLIESGNVTLGVHGLVHSTEEFKHKSAQDAYDSLLDADFLFRKAKLPVESVFKGPHWGINAETYKALIDLGYTHVYTHPDYANLAEQFPEIKSVFYNWNLKDDFVDNGEKVIIGHGHTHDVCGNGIAQCKDRIINFCREHNPEYKFIHEI